MFLSICRTLLLMLLQGDFSIYGGWLYISFVVNLSVCYAFYCLGMFYFVLKTPLAPFDPVPKFLCIKAVLFLSFWQVRVACYETYGAAQSLLGTPGRGRTEWLRRCREMGTWAFTSKDRGEQPWMTSLPAPLYPLIQSHPFAARIRAS